MNKIKRLPTLEEARVKSYRELFYQVKNLQSIDSVFQLAPPQVMPNPEAMNYPVFEFTLDEVKDAYLPELENKFKDMKEEIYQYRDNFVMRGKDVAYNLYMKYFEKYL